MPSTLSHLRHHTTIVADTCDFHALSTYHPRDATTNPSHVLTASRQPEHAHLLSAAASAALAHSPDNDGDINDPDHRVDLALLHLLVSFGTHLLAHVPGRVSTEVDPTLAFNTPATIAHARRITALYAQHGVAAERILVKIPATWEGLQAVKVLEAEGVRCNVTLVFGMAQAVLAGEVGATLISPFVGRLAEWWRERCPGEDFGGARHPGVRMARGIWEYYRARGIETEVMGASMRSLEECEGLAGLDLMTMGVPLLKELEEGEVEIKRVLDPGKVERQSDETQFKSYIDDEAAFRTDLFNDQGAHDKMADMMRQFMRDNEATKDALRELLQAK